LGSSTETQNPAKNASYPGILRRAATGYLHYSLKYDVQLREESRVVARSHKKGCHSTGAGVTSGHLLQIKMRYARGYFKGRRPGIFIIVYYSCNSQFASSADGIECGFKYGDTEPA
jgi:hypothetical protein